VQIVFHNKDRRRVSVNSYRFVLAIFGTNSPTTNEVRVAGSDTAYSEVDVDQIDITAPVLVYDLSVDDDGTSPHLKGIATLVIPGVDLDLLTADSYAYSIKAFDQFDGQHPAYVDDNTGALGVVDIIGGAFSLTEPLNYVDLGTL
jgi:hypothetical protein